MPPTPSQSITMSNFDTKHRSSTPSTSYRENVVDHDAPMVSRSFHTLFACLRAQWLCASAPAPPPSFFSSPTICACAFADLHVCLTILPQSPTSYAALSPVRVRGQTESMSTRSNRSNAARCRYAVRPSIDMHGRSLMLDSNLLRVTARSPLVFVCVGFWDW